MGVAAEAPTCAGPDPHPRKPRLKFPRRACDTRGEATDRATAEHQDRAPGHLAALEDAITGVSRSLAQAIVRDGEGATKFVTVCVERGRSEAECRKVAYSIAHSPLVKTAFFASDPNLGRILAAAGNSGVDVSRLSLYLDDVLVASGGGRHPSYSDEQGVAVMKKAEFMVRVLLGRGKADATVWTCDFSFDYVRINAEYRT